jgi:hypothetical protein
MKEQKVLSIILIGICILRMNVNASSESSDSYDSSVTDGDDSNSSRIKMPPYEVGLKCNRGFLNAYGIDGVDDAHVHGMTLCEDVKYSCCSPIDELKFHKNWFGYYKVKLEETHKRMIQKYKRLAQILEVFKELPIKDHKDIIKNNRFKEAEEVHKLLVKGGIDPELIPILDELENLQQKDIKDKKGVFCMFCNYDNHEFFGLTGGTVLINQTSCQEIIQDSGLMLQIRNKLLQPLIMLVHRLLSLYAVNYYDRIEWDLIREARLHMDLVNMCFPTENADFVLEKCKGICDRFNIVENSEIIFGEFDLYTYLIGRFDKFEEWLPLALEDPKKHTKQWVEKDEEEEKNEEEGEGNPDEEGEGNPDEEGEGDNEGEEGEKIKKRILTSSSKKKRNRKSYLRSSYDDNIEIINDNKERILSLKGLKKIAYRKRKSLKSQRRNKETKMENELLEEKILDVESKIRNYKKAIKDMKKNNKKMLKRMTSSRKNYREIQKSLRREKEFFIDPMETRKLGFNGSADSMVQRTFKQRKRKRTKSRMNKTEKMTREKQKSKDRSLNQQQEESSEESEAESKKDENESLIYADPETLEKKNVDCNKCESSIGSADSMNVEDSQYIFRSKDIKNSKFLEDSENCDFCEHGIGLKNCVNVTHSNFTTDSQNVTKSVNVTNSTNVKNSTFVEHSNKVEDSNKIFSSEDVRLSNNCRGCHNCFNCTNCKNVTNCKNCHNVTDSVNVTNAKDSVKIFNSTDILNGYNLTNATNMTNASSCANCTDRENCQGKACNEPVKSEFELALETKIYYSTMEIAERLYGMTTMGDAESYLENEDEFDPFLYRANNLLYDLSRYRSIFDEDGIVLDFRTTEEFIKDKKSVIEAATKHLIKKDSDYLDDGVKTGLIDPEDDGFDIRISDLINKNSDFLSVHNFLRDAQSGVISYESMQEKNDLEMEAYDEYLETIGQEEGGGIVECEEGASGFEDCLSKKRMVEQVLKKQQIELMQETLEKKEEAKDGEGEEGETKEEENKEENS